MAKITLTLSLDNAAFDDEAGGWRREVARILLTQSRQIEAGWHGATPDTLPAAIDHNGNSVGGWTFDPELPGSVVETDRDLSDSDVQQIREVWLGDPDAAPWAQLLEQMPTIEEGQYHDLKIDETLTDPACGTYRTKVWLARTGLGDGEPFIRTVYVEYLDGDSWCDLGYYDGSEPELRPDDVLARAALRHTRDLAWENS